MSNEQTSPAMKWVLIVVIAVSVCTMGACVLFMAMPVEEYRIAGELESREFQIRYKRQGYEFWRLPASVWGGDRSITKDDCRLIGRLPHLQSLIFQRCDLSGLNLDDIVNCRELGTIYYIDVTPFPADETRKLAAGQITVFTFQNACLNDSDLEDFAKMDSSWSTRFDR